MTADTTSWFHKVTAIARRDGIAALNAKRTQPFQSGDDYLPNEIDDIFSSQFRPSQSKGTIALSKIIKKQSILDLYYFTMLMKNVEWSARYGERSRLWNAMKTFPAKTLKKYKSTLAELENLGWIASVHKSNLEMELLRSLTDSKQGRLYLAGHYLKEAETSQQMPPVNIALNVCLIILVTKIKKIKGEPRIDLVFKFFKEQHLCSDSMTVEILRKRFRDLDKSFDLLYANLRRHFIVYALELTIDDAPIIPNNHYETSEYYDIIHDKYAQSTRIFKPKKSTKK